LFVFWSYVYMILGSFLKVLHELFHSITFVIVHTELISLNTQLLWQSVVCLGYIPHLVEASFTHGSWCFQQVMIPLRSRHLLRRSTSNNLLNSLSHCLKFTYFKVDSFMTHCQSDLCLFVFMILTIKLGQMHKCIRYKSLITNGSTKPQIRHSCMLLVYLDLILLSGWRFLYLYVCRRLHLLGVIFSKKIFFEVLWWC